MKNLIALSLILGACSAYGQQTRKGLDLVVENKETHKKVFFDKGTKINVDLGYISLRGIIIRISDSSVTISRHVNGKIVDQNIEVKKIVSMGRAKKTAPVVIGTMMLIPGVLIFAGGASVAGQPDSPNPRGLYYISNKDTGDAEMVFGGMLIAGGLPLIWPRRTYSSKKWNFYTLSRTAN
jgi:hypothetical protein